MPSMRASSPSMPQRSKPCASTSVSLCVANTHPAAFELAAQRTVVVDLAVLEREDAAAARGEGLIARREIDDGQPSHAERDARLEVRSLAVGPAMTDRFEHRAQERRRRRLPQVEDSGDAAHGRMSCRRCARARAPPADSTLTSCPIRAARSRSSCRARLGAAFTRRHDRVRPRRAHRRVPALALRLRSRRPLDRHARHYARETPRAAPTVSAGSARRGLRRQRSRGGACSISAATPDSGRCMRCAKATCPPLCPCYISSVNIKSGLPC